MRWKRLALFLGLILPSGVIAQPAKSVPAQVPKHFENLQWLIGHWNVVDGDVVLSMSFEFADNANHINSSLTWNNRDKKLNVKQWLVWDAVDRKIRGWAVFSDGTLNESIWTQKDGKWTVENVQKRFDGKKATFINVLAPIDADSHTVEMIEMVVDGKAMPLPPKLTAKRRK